MRNFKTLFYALSVSIVTLQACSSDDDTPITEQNTEYKEGIFVLNEGSMGSSNAEVTFYKNGTASQNIFKTVNPKLTLGNVATSMHFDDKKGFIVVNLSNKIEVVEENTFRSIGTISSNLNNPRYITSDNQNIYITNWGDASNPNDDFVAVFRKADLSFVKKINVVEGPDKILVENNKLVIAHSGGWSNGNSVSIYNLTSNVLENIEVGDVPNGMVEEDGFVYILCSGVTWGGTPSSGKLVKLNLATNSITQTIDFPDGQNPQFLVEENNQLYYTLNNSIYSLSTQATNLPTSALFTSNATYIYSFDIINNTIYIGDAKDFSSYGEVQYYSLSGNILGKFGTGIGPNFITKN